MTKPTLRSILLLLLAAPALGAAPPASRATRGLPTVDALSEEQPRARMLALGPADQALLRPGMPLHVHEQLGVPSFLWASGQGGAARGLRAAASPAAAARAHLSTYAHLYRMGPAEVEALELRELHDTGRGAIIARFGQRVQGIEVFRGELKVAMDRASGLISISGSITGDGAALAGPPAFRLGPQEALSRGLDDLHGTPLMLSDLRALGTREGVEEFALDEGSPLSRTVHFSQPARARQVLFRHADRLEPAWYVELFAGSPQSSDSECYAYVISAADGRVLHRNDLTVSDSFSYRVWADTSGLHTPYSGPQGHGGTPFPPGTAIDAFRPTFVAQNLVALAHGPITAHDDPWLAAGATSTVGNNADAYADLFAPDGYSPDKGDFRAEITGAKAFDRIYDVTKAATSTPDQQKAAITQLFYNVNYFHDWYYEAGFNEVAGNAQDGNYGRGGREQDSLKAEAQDRSGRNNANMATPADGGRPRMQMYIWTGLLAGLVEITAPASIAKKYSWGDALFGPQVFDVSGQVVQALSGTATDACAPITNGAALSGKIAFVDRGTCKFVEKVQAAQDAGAIGVLIANNQDGLGRMAGSGTPSVDNKITIPAMMVYQVDGDAIRPLLGAGVALHMKKAAPDVDRDGAVDNTIVAHEWGHYISNRLVFDANGLGTNMSRGMGEGWADFHAMLMVVKAEDKNVSGNDHWQGSYGLAAYAQNGDPTSYYYGLRRVPYSTDLTKDPLTFKHVQDGVALPTTAPLSWGADGADNSEVHNTGEVWATMLWECWATLLNDSRYTFAQARDRMRDYIVASYKLTPASPTFLEARDALLAAAQAGDATGADLQHFIEAFARRGAGLKAVSPDRYSPDNVGVVEDATTTQVLQVVSIAADDSVTALCGADGILQAGETGKLTVTIRNLGSVAIAGVSGALSSTNAHVTFPAGATLTFGSVAPFKTGSAQARIALDAATTGMQAVDVKVVLSHASLTQTFSATAPVRANYHDVAWQSATDDVESPVTAWTHVEDHDLDDSVPWRRIEVSPVDHRWAALQSVYMSDLQLVSPPVTVAPEGGLKVVFRHRHSFPKGETSAGDLVPVGGGVLEMSINNGTTWEDLGHAATGDVYDQGTFYPGLYNPLENRNGWAGDNPAYPGFDTVTVTGPAAYAGKTVLIRFRLGSGYFIGAPGWEIDDIQIQGITNRPFHALVPATTTCVQAPTANAGAAQTVAAHAAVTLDGSGSTGGTLTYQWSQTAGPTARLTGATSAQATFAAPNVAQNTKLTFALVVSNGTLFSAPATVDVNVTPNNRAPVADAGKGQTVALNATVTLDGSASSDADGDPLTYKWRQLSGTAVSLSDPAIAKPTFTMATGDARVFELVVNDGIADSPAAQVTISVASSGGCASGGGIESAPAALVLLGTLLLRRCRRR